MPKTVSGSPNYSRIPIDFFTVAVISFATGLLAAPWVIPEAIVFFYQPATLALVHTFTLGWITSAIMGVMYRYAPAVARRPLPYPRIAAAQLILFVIGASGMVTHFALGSWSGVWSAALVVIASVILFAINIGGCLWPRFSHGTAETGMLISVGFLIVSACVGFALALDKSYGFLRGNVITNLAAHAQIAAVGWVTLTICAVSYRMLPAFLLPRVTIPRAATYQLYALAIGAAGLGAAMLAGTRSAAIFAGIVIVALFAYLFTIARIVRTRRRSIDWTARHALAGAAYLILAAVLGAVLAWTGVSGEITARVAAVYGLAGLMGFFSNFIIGMSYQLFPGFVVRVRTARGWPSMTVAELGFRGPRSLVFMAFNAGLIAIGAGMMLAETPLGVVGAVAMAVGGIVYAGGTLRTLSYAYRAGRAGAVRPAD